ncbi:hypothetical protein N7468_004462 [Penicillium chermesinum]|uniref:AMP-activated protein kinase glycogen-binding domain-containing protein n=1 Tax=Penicillium chermesinum TaxID=63820 RepID=A0A9W9TT82_9EURO|nr:uncharacterized protein N7468_004462 [Penicillium chermesinum]KAJ5239843.1 hypothetical protein N7468_004462 [Penicillium chermesinum]
MVSPCRSIADVHAVELPPGAAACGEFESFPPPIQWHRLSPWIGSLTGRFLAFASRPETASEVFVTGTFDDWGKTVKLDRVGDVFEKEVTLPVEKTQYKFVVDGVWTTDKKVRQESDGHNNINNVLLPEEITPVSETSGSTPAMSGVTPDSTTATLAADVPKEQPNGNLPGAFPETPAQETEKAFSVNPIPASEGIGNPIQLQPGEKVPDPSTIHNNTIDSTVKLDKESYEKPDSVPFTGAGAQNESPDSSAFNVPPVSKNTIPESSLPIGGPAQQAAAADPGYMIQSAAPTSTTAALAAEVPLEKDKQASDATIQSAAPTSTATDLASEVPLEKKKDEEEQQFSIQPAPSEPPVTESKETNNATIQSAAPTSTTAALAAAVPLEKDKKENGTEPVSDVPEVVKESLAEAHQDPEAAANKEAVEEKKDVEQELQKTVGLDESQGAPAPTVTAATSAIAPGVAANTGFDSANVSPTSSPPPGRAAPTSAPPPAESKDIPASTESNGPAVTTGVTTGNTAEVTTPKPAESHKDEKKKKRLSGFFSKLKEKLK